jgi:hypothetical protein
MVSIDEWVASLPPELPEAEPTTQDALLGLRLPPLDNVRELREGAAPLRKPVEPVPPHALAKFRFKLVAHKSLALVWSTKHTTSRADLSLWAPDVDTSTPLHKRSRVRLCLGHTCSDGLDPPGKGGRGHPPLVLEVTDSAVSMAARESGLGSSDHLASVVEQLCPLPVRYRLAWHSFQHKPPLYVWRAVPPSGHFLALGMVATTSEDPPPLSAMHCVPRRWCERQAAPAKLQWRDDGQGGRPGSFWLLPHMELVVAGQGAEPPEEALACWALKAEKATADNTGWLVMQ